MHETTTKLIFDDEECAKEDTRIQTDRHRDAERQEHTDTQTQTYDAC